MDFLNHKRAPHVQVGKNEQSLCSGTFPREYCVHFTFTKIWHCFFVFIFMFHESVDQISRTFLPTGQLFSTYEEQHFINQSPIIKSIKFSFTPIMSSGRCLKINKSDDWLKVADLVIKQQCYLTKNNLFLFIRKKQEKKKSSV